MFHPLCGYYFYFKELKSVSSTILSLSPVLVAMTEKLEDYFRQAESKKVYYITSILDPRIKLQFFKREV